MRVAVFVSGRGSNMKALLDENPLIDFFVFSNKKEEPQAFGWAKKRGAYTQLISSKTTEDWKNLASLLNSLRVSRVFLLGFMKIVPEVFLSEIKAECVNLHPSVLPDFPGLDSIRKTFDDKRSMGCTVHRVSDAVDAGEIFLQKQIKLADLNFTRFEEQVHQAEQDAVSKFCGLRLVNAEAV